MSSQRCNKCVYLQRRPGDTILRLLIPQVKEIVIALNYKPRHFKRAGDLYKRDFEMNALQHMDLEKIAACPTTGDCGSSGNSLMSVRLDHYCSFCGRARGEDARYAYAIDGEAREASNRGSISEHR